MPKKTFESKALSELVYESIGESIDGLTLIRKELVSTTRWDLVYYVVIKEEDKFWGFSFTQGKTEYQDYNEFDHCSVIDAWQVTPIEKTVIDYVTIKD